MNINTSTSTSTDETDILLFILNNLINCKITENSKWEYILNIFTNKMISDFLKMQFKEKITTNNITYVNNTLSDVYENIQAIIQSIPCMDHLEFSVSITECKPYYNMLFLTISDNKDSIKAIVLNKYNVDYDLLQIGNNIKITAYVSTYKGQIQLYIKDVKQDIIQDTQFNITKNKIIQLGYTNRNVQLQESYKIIGVISSLQAAGCRDFLHTLLKQNTGKTIYIYQTLVQGTKAATNLRKTIQFANSHNKCEIIAMIRGGGSKEDLECFNNEDLAKEIYNSKIPIVTGIGHEIDTSIADLVSAKSFITPTETAIGITRSNKIHIENYKDHLLRYKKNILKLMLEKNNYLRNYLQTLNNKMTKIVNVNIITYKNILTSKLQYRKNNIQNYLIKINNYYMMCKIKTYDISTINTNIQMYINKTKNKLLTLNTPKIVDIKGNKIFNKSDLKKGDKIKIIFFDGEIEVTINNT
jgi:exodeoxyribonuclease VII large subunit